MVVAPCPEAIAQGDSTGGLAARSRELLLQLTSHDETPENSTPRPRDKGQSPIHPSIHRGTVQDIVTVQSINPSIMATIFCVVQCI